jgi:putative pyruvate formate lyase activating enzyme
VGGEPTVHIPAILEAMAGCGPLPPVVWKSNFFGTPAAFALLEAVVDVYVADFKFGNDACAQQISGVDRYWQTVTRNLLQVAATGACLMVRHLLLPGHFDCCYRAVVDWMADCLPAVPLRIMGGYLPRWQAARYNELAAPLDRQHALRAHAVAAEKGLNVIA